MRLRAPAGTQVLTADVARPLTAVWDFALDPAATPRWLAPVRQETASTSTPADGTIYTQTRRDGTVTEHVLTEVTPGRSFTFTAGHYHCRYDFTARGPDRTLLTYREWTDDGEPVSRPLRQADLDAFKQAAEHASRP